MTKAKVGRPRSKKSQAAIMNATHALLNEKGGGRLTIEAIARQAGVGKPTIYRWWPSLADIVLEALLHQADASITVPSSESLPATLNHFLKQSLKAITDGAGVHLRFLMAQAQQDEDFCERFRVTFVAKRRAVLLAILQQAVVCREADSGQNLEILVDIVFGAMWYRLLIGHASLDESFADELTAVITGVVQTNPKTR